VAIDDITDKCKKIHSLVLDKKIEEAKSLLPLENIYSISNELKLLIGGS